MLLQMGWNFTRGLGKNEDGILTPIPIFYNHNTRGLGAPAKETPDYILCEQCELYLLAVDMKTHLKGKKHIKKLKSLGLLPETELNLPKPGQQRQAMTCQYCDITMDENNWAAHINGKKHKKMVLAQELTEMELNESQLTPNPSCSLFPPLASSTLWPIKQIPLEQLHHALGLSSTQRK